MWPNTFVSTNVGFGGRAYAFMIDWCIRAVLAWVILLIGGGASILFQGTELTNISGVVVGLSGALYFLYHPVLECIMKGRTPGKKMACIAVVGPNGAPPGVAAIIVRNILRLVDAFPVLYLVGFLSILYTKRNLRIGDMVAKTQLIYTHRIQKRTTEGQVERELTTAEQQTLMKFLNQWETMAPEKRQKLAYAFLKKIGRPLDGQPEEALQDRLRAIAKQYMSSSDDGL